MRRIHPINYIKKDLKRGLLFGGQGWIRTIEDIVDGFTVRCIWPLCNLPIINGASERNRTFNLLITSQLLYHWATLAYPFIIFTLRNFHRGWCPKVDKLSLSGDLTFGLVPKGGIEPPTQGFSVPCSTDWAIWANGDSEGARTLDL